MIDLHCDTLMKLIDFPQEGDLFRNPWQIDIEKLQRAKYTLQNFAIYIDLVNTPSPFMRYEAMRDIFLKNVKTYGEYITHITSYQDIVEAKASGQIGALLSIEEGGVLEGDIDRLDAVYQDGVRLITMSWNYPNGLSFPQGKEHEGKGLTELGRAFVARMEELGIIVDVSHLNDAGTRELLEIARKPFIASHSCARALKEHGRNLPDDIIRAMADKGGLIGVAFAKNFLGIHPTTRIEDIVRHIRHIVNVGGIESVAIGTDFDGTNSDMEIKDASEMPKLRDALQKADFNEREIDFILEENALRICKELL